VVEDTDPPRTEECQQQRVLKPLELVQIKSIPPTRCVPALLLRPAAAVLCTTWHGSPRAQYEMATCLVCSCSASLPKFFKLQGAMLMTFNHGEGSQAARPACEINAVVAAQAWVGSFWWRSWRRPSQAGAVLSCWPCVLASTGMTTTTALLLNFKDFIFATHRISNGTNGLKDCQCFSGPTKKTKGISRNGRRANGEKLFCSFSYCLFVCHTEISPRLEYTN
jgi:hypothetical protein